MKVSIITISYNNLEGLKDTYRSIRQQTFCDYEWIVVDGGSTDGTKEFLEEHDKEIVWWCSEPDKGVYNAQNKGTSHARGEYCIYMNSGDSFYAADVLDKIFERETDADIVYGNWMLVFEDGKTRLGQAPKTADLAYFFDNNMCHQSMLIKTQVVMDRPYDESFRIYADWEEWLSLYMQGKTFERRDIIVCNFIVGGISTGDDAPASLKAERKAEIKRIQERYYPEPWRKTLPRVTDTLREYDAMKERLDEDSAVSFYMTANERHFFSEKRKKHNKIIRVLIYVCCLLLTANIATILYILYR